MSTKKIDERDGIVAGEQNAEEQMTEEQVAAAKKAEAKAYMNQRVKVKIHSDPNDPAGGMLDVKLSCNGDMVLVRRDEVVLLKRKHLCALRDAVKKTYVLDANGSVVGEKLVPRFSYTVM